MPTPSSEATAPLDGARHQVRNEPLPQRGEEKHDHIVQFYEDEAFLVDVITNFLMAGFDAGEPLVVIAREAHRTAVTQRLASRGLDVQAACGSGQLTLLDAQETLSRFMVGGMPDWGLFEEIIGGVLEKSRATGRGAQIRAYGEMVDLLCADGNPNAAIRLEEMWNGIGKCYPFSLLCAYDMGNFQKGVHAQPFHEVCGAHSHVIPAESYSRIEDPDARLREVSLLQQRARALESEIEHRKQVEKELLEALRMRDDFLSVAGHELKTPLTALQLQLQFLLGLYKETGEEGLRERLGKACRHTERLATLVEELLDVSRISAGRLNLEVEALDLSRLVRDTVERASEAAARAECHVSVLATEPVEGQWDRLRIEQVVTNLLTNALKYGRGHPVEVMVKGASDRARLVVRDHGIGILLEHQSRIFNRFERAVSSRHFGGLGLGLWIVRQIVEAHGGTIHVESELGKGATFVVDLPYSCR